MAIGSQFFQTPPPEIPLNIQTLPPLPSPKPKVKKKSCLYSPDFENRKLGSKKQQRLSNFSELLKHGWEIIDIDPFPYRHNLWDELSHELLVKSQPDLDVSNESADGAYRLCRPEKQIRAMVKRNKFGYELVSKVESLLIDLVSLSKPGQLNLVLKDSFERLLIHILCRYYRLQSISIPDSQGKTLLISYDGKSNIPSESFTDFFYK